jgi:8-amino-7-oxononanoate synthase
LIDWLWNTARPQVFSTAMPPACAAAAAAAIDVIVREPERRHHLAAVSRQLRARLIEERLNIPPTAVPTPIIPVIVGDETRTMAAAAQLEERGFLVGAIRPPSVPRGTSRLRISLNSSVTSEDLDRLVPAIIDVLT